MITQPTYYKREVYIANAAPSITDNVSDVQGQLLDTIEEYEREALLFMGYRLAIDFMAVLDDTQENGLVVGADEKWNELLNGKTYTSPSSGIEVTWRGIRFKSSSSQAIPDMSLLAYYVYYFYQSNDYISIGTAGAQIEVAANAERVVPTQKVIKAWRKFVEMIQGEFFYKEPEVYYRGIGVDWYGNVENHDISLYRFIEDMNTITNDYYEGFAPQRIINSNQFGI